MTHLRAAKIEKIAENIPPLKVDSGKDSGKLLVLGWGSTCGAIKTAVRDCIDHGYDVSHVHLHHINPFPKNLGEVLKNFDTVLIPEMNTGQLLQLIRAKYLIPAIGLSKVQGQPYTTSELKNKIIELLK